MSTETKLKSIPKSDKRIRLLVPTHTVTVDSELADSLCPVQQTFIFLRPFLIPLKSFPLTPALLPIYNGARDFSATHSCTFHCSKVLNQKLVSEHGILPWKGLSTDGMSTLETLYPSEKLGTNQSCPLWNRVNMECSSEVFACCAART